MLGGNQAHAEGQYRQAAECFNEALRLQPQDAMDKAALHYNLANAKRELGQPQEAAQHYQAALQFDPNDADTHNNLGNVQRELGQLDLAIPTRAQPQSATASCQGAPGASKTACLRLARLA
jgi:tetratricopeptide (TPR) repeat protein